MRTQRPGRGIEDGPKASFAGIHRSVLHVRGGEAICRAMLRCFASLWTPTAVAYRRRLGIADDDVLCGIVLCAMVSTPGGDEPQSAGVAFSCDPRTGRRDLIVINAARGIGEPVVSGVVSMFAWSLIMEAIDGILYAGPRLRGYEIPLGMQTIKRIDGHAYFDLTALQWCWYDFVGSMPAQTVATIGGHQPEIPVPPGDPLMGAAGRRRKKTRLKILWRMLGFNRRARRVFQEHLAEVRAVAALPWATLGNDAMLQAIARLVELHERLDPVIGLSNGYASAFKNLLDVQLRKVAGERAPGLMARLLAGSGEVTSAEQGYRIVDLASTTRGDPAALAWLQQREPAATWETLPADSPFKHEFARFLGDFGHRGVYEADVINPRWHDDPGYILDQVRCMLNTPYDGDRRQAARQVSVEAWVEVKPLTRWRRPLLRWLVGQVQRGFALREAGKSSMVASLWPTRRLLLELGCRLTVSGHLERPEQVFHLSKVDLLGLLSGHWDGHGAGALAHDRAAQREVWLTLAPPDVIVEGEGADGLVSGPKADHCVQRSGVARHWRVIRAGHRRGAHHSPPG